MFIDVCIPQSNRSHDVQSFVPSDHLCSPAGVRCLLGYHCLVSFYFVDTQMWKTYFKKKINKNAVHFFRIVTPDLFKCFYRTKNLCS